MDLRQMNCVGSDWKKELAVGLIGGFCERGENYGVV
jgi:hypothetical protein